MGTKFKILVVVLVVGVAAFAGLKYFEMGVVQVLAPKGEIAQKESDLFWLSTWLMMIVVVPVFIATVWVAWKYRVGKGGKYEPNWDNSNIAELTWWTVPVVIIGVLSYYTYKSCHELNPFKPIVSEVAPVKIQVVALQWKWLFIYPEYNIATVNFVQFPEKTPLNFEITADAPMNSFWIPQLGSQIYAMPGMRSRVHLIAQEAGTFFGTSANLSGEGFSGMKFTAKACSAEEFQTWVQQKGAPLSYEALVLPSMYNAPAFYQGVPQGLFDGVIMKYMMPMEKKDVR